ncbi:hypothetical protein JMJ35_007916 [Cladonia borealis]|uniref:Uncharacterized protein n=1 Tax=Cladonia borealis TaxID=184061 RepID=A0AA39QUL4_9LECA|nr:hypothetical protein JMJ35_007916 [Cladonia borealis]
MDQKNFIKLPDQVPPTLESLPRELQLQICREMLRSEKPIILCPCDVYIRGFAFGSLGILRVSKHFSEMALSVMYGENCFRLISAEFTIENECLKNNDPDEDDFLLENDHLEDADLLDDTRGVVCIEALRHGPWENLRNIPDALFDKVVSSVDCLDMISQTSSGQKFLKHLQIDFGRVAWMRVMDGVLLRILKRMRGLQSVELDILRDWYDLIPEISFNDEETEIWHERNARDFLLLVREELSHIKKITMDNQAAHHWLDDTTIIDWMADELKKRNEAWTPPLPPHKEFRRTFSPMSIMDADVAKSVVDFDDEFRSKYHEINLSNLERRCGVF